MTRAATKESAFWDWSLDRYRLAKAELLALQDRRGFNVNLLLWCVWRAQAGETLSALRIKEAAAAIEAWHSAVTKPVRGARRRLAEFGDSGAQIKPRAQALELEAERVEQEILEKLPAPAIAEPPMSILAARAIHNLETYAALAGTGRNAGYSEEIAALAAALLP